MRIESYKVVGSEKIVNIEVTDKLEDSPDEKYYKKLAEMLERHKFDPLSKEEEKILIDQMKEIENHNKRIEEVYKNDN